MKRLILLLALAPLALASVQLAESGRIVARQTPPPSFHEVHTCAGGVVEFEKIDHSPVTITLRDNSGAVRGVWETRQAINPVFSPGRRWLAYSTGRELRVLDTATGEMTTHALAEAFNIDDMGRLAVWRADEGQVSYAGERLAVDGVVRGLLWRDGALLVHTREAIIDFAGGETLCNARGSLLDAIVDGGALYVSDKRSDGAHLLHIGPGELREFDFAPTPAPAPGARTHLPIPAPLMYGEDAYPFPIGNSYLEIQNYSGAPYLHPGVDFLGEANQPVYAVADGVVKAVITTGGELYWRVAVGLEDTPSTCEGYLYAHLNEASITVATGDSVHTGDMLGTLVEWPSFDFHHCHFARLEDTGTVWSGDWWTADDPQRDVWNLVDNTPPEFQDARQGQLFAFRYGLDDYADPTALSGQVDIIARASDFANSDWRIAISRIGYRIAMALDPDSTLVDQLSFTFDYPNDDYGAGVYDWQCLSTIYSRDSDCNSVGNYDMRDYYYILSHADADSAITDDDINQRFDTTLFPDGPYILTVWAEDGAGNRTEASMDFSIDNDPNVAPVFHDMPSQLYIPTQGAVTFDLWSHVSDDNTPDEYIDFAFDCANENLLWYYTVDTGVLTFMHIAPISQMAEFHITATDMENTSAEYTLDLILNPNDAGEDIPPLRTSLACSPNPFNPSTTILLTLAQDSHAVVEAFDARGRHVATLLDEPLPAGEHRLAWNADDLPSGVYFVRLTAGDRTITRKALLLK